MISAHDVARELRKRIPDVGRAKLHKLLYYCQGWHLARNGEPLFDESIEAWVNGPVVADLWLDEKHRNRAAPAPRTPDPAALEIIEYVIERYGRWSGTALIRHTHQETPWQRVSERDDPFPDTTIDQTSMQEFFAALDEVYSFEPMHLTPERRKIIDAAKARTA